MRLSLRKILQEGGWQASLNKNNKNSTNEQELDDSGLEKADSEDRIPGGKGDKLNPSDVDQEQLMKGIHVEFEHTNDVMLAMEISLDHLAEDPNYYTKLATIDPHNSEE